jgi:hypothetical protein
LVLDSFSLSFRVESRTHLRNELVATSLAIYRSRRAAVEKWISDLREVFAQDARQVVVFERADSIAIPMRIPFQGQVQG